MKQRKNLKKLLSLIVSAVMLLSVLSIGAMAEDSVPTSDVYTIDAENFKVYVKDEVPYVGDFLKQIDSHGSYKGVVDENENVITYGQLKQGMKLQIGTTKYDIEVPVLFSLESEIKDIPAETVVFDFDKTDGQTISDYWNSMETDAYIKNFIVAVSVPASGIYDDQNNAYVKITVKEDESLGKYLQIDTNSYAPFLFTTKAFPDYVNEASISKYVQTEVKAQFPNNVSADSDSGFLMVGRRYTVTNQEDGTSATSAADAYVTDTKGMSDYVSFNRQGYFNMGGTRKETWTGSGRAVHTALKDTDIHTVHQYHSITLPETTVEVKSLYLDKTLQSGHRKGAYNGLTEFSYPVATGYEVRDMADGLIFVGTKGKGSASEPTYGEQTIINLYDYNVKVAKDFTDATGVTHDVKLNTSNGTNNGYAVDYTNKTVSNVIKGMTAKELVDSLILPVNSYARVTKTDNYNTLSDIYSDNEPITIDGAHYLALTNASTGANRGFKINFATFEDITVNGTTVSRTCSNNVLGKFIFAAYDASGKMIAAKVAENINGTASAEFAGIDGIDSYRSFVFSNPVSLIPATDVTSAN